jgi:hypothetical protein
MNEPQTPLNPVALPPLHKTPVCITIRDKTIAGLVDIITEIRIRNRSKHRFKMLNNIKPELVELNDMVGMKSLKNNFFTR